MSFEQMLGLGVALIVMGVGLIGCLVPAIPGTPLVLAAAIGHRLYFGDASASNLVLGLIILLSLVGLGLDYLASVLGARKLGATWRGVAGVIIGATVGLFFSLPGLILGPFIGAMLFEMMGGRETNEAMRAGFGALIGVFVGALGKFACCGAMIGLFTYSVVRRSGEFPPELATLLLNLA